MESTLKSRWRTVKKTALFSQHKVMSHCILSTNIVILLLSLINFPQKPYSFLKLWLLIQGTVMFFSASISSHRTKKKKDKGYKIKGSVTLLPRRESMGKTWQSYSADHQSLQPINKTWAARTVMLQEIWPLLHWDVELNRSCSPHHCSSPSDWIAVCAVLLRLKKMPKYEYLWR